MLYSPTQPVATTQHVVFLCSLAVRRPPAVDRRRPAGAEDQPVGSREAARDDTVFMHRRGSWGGGVGQG